MTALLLAVKHELERQHIAHRMAQIARDTASTATSPEPARGATAPGDARKLRGIPALARGVTGAIPGTTPHNVR